MTDQSTAQRPFSSAFDTTRNDTSSESDLDSDISDRPPVDLYPEEGELSDDQEVSFTNPDQSLSEEQSYRETMRGFSHIWDGPTFRMLMLVPRHRMTTLCWP